MIMYMDKSQQVLILKDKLNEQIANLQSLTDLQDFIGNSDINGRPITEDAIRRTIKIQLELISDALQDLSGRI